MQDELKQAMARAMAKAEGYALADEPIVVPEDDGFTPPRLSIGNAVEMYSHLIEAALDTRTDPALAAAQVEVARLRAENERLSDMVAKAESYLPDDVFAELHGAAWVEVKPGSAALVAP
jgi:hypothetical protein